jgi:hypothetical protein
MHRANGGANSRLSPAAAEPESRSPALAPISRVTRFRRFPRAADALLSANGSMNSRLFQEKRWSGAVRCYRFTGRTRWGFGLTIRPDGRTAAVVGHQSFPARGSDSAAT